MHTFLKRKLVFIFSLVIFSAQAKSKKELQDRLSFINSELQKIEKRVESGQDRSLFQKYVSEFETERKSLNLELKKYTNKFAKVAKPKAVVRKKKKRSNPRFFPRIKLKSSASSADRLNEILFFLEVEKKRKLILLSRGARKSEITQVETNIAFLEYEKTAIERKDLLGIGGSSDKKSMFSYKGHFQLRTESAKNTRGVQDSRLSPITAFRLRTYFTVAPNKKLKFNLTPQATKGFGQNNSSGNSTSGSTNHTGVDFFEANIDYNIWGPLTLKIGRQELSYGDHLIIGALPWANTGRSFDGAKLSYNYDLGKTDLFYSKISDNSTAVDNTGDDTNLFSIYNSWSYGKYFKNIDLYYIALNNKLAGQAEANTIGLRVKGNYGPVFFRTENSIQKGSSLGDDAYQYNLEIGSKWKAYSASLELAVAGENYRQIFPTAHKFLGYADVLGRRNLKHMALHLQGAPTQWLLVKADYHVFKRNSTDVSAFKLNGATAHGVSGSSDDIGHELDLVLIFKTKNRLKFQLGAALFMPGQYMKDQYSQYDETVRFLYGQVNASF